MKSNYGNNRFLSSNLTASEHERLAYITGDTSTSRTLGDLALSESDADEADDYLTHTLISFDRTVDLLREIAAKLDHLYEVDGAAKLGEVVVEMLDTLDCNRNDQTRVAERGVRQRALSTALDRVCSTQLKVQECPCESN